MRDKTIIEVKKSKCTGCNACAEICSHQAIKMKQTSEGFYYPVVDDDKCIMCGKCSTVCVTFENVEKNKNNDKYVYVAHDKIRWKVGDGGAVYDLIRFVINEGGRACVPVFSDDYKEVRHTFISTLDEMNNIAYEANIESYINGIFQNIKSELENNIKILFLGVPCQVIGLKKYLDKEYENLITVDVKCEGVSSQKLWENYLENKVNKDANSKLKFVQFNSKSLGWRKSIKIKYVIKNNEIAIYDGLHTDNFLYAHNNGIILRKSCYECSYTEEGDFSVSNFREVDKYDKKYNDGKGISCVSVNSEKAKEILNNILQEASMTGKVLVNTFQNRKFDAIQDKLISRKQFIENAETYGFDKAISYYKHDTYRDYVEQRRIIDYHMGDKMSWKIVFPNVWKRRKIGEREYLYTNGEKWKRIFMSLKLNIIPEIEYFYDIKFKINTNANELRLMVTDNGTEKSEKFDILWHGKVKNDEWLRVTGKYCSKNLIMKYFMLASTDFVGDDNYICFEWIRIWEAE